MHARITGRASDDRSPYGRYRAVTTGGLPVTLVTVEQRGGAEEQHLRDGARLLLTLGHLRGFPRIVGEVSLPGGGWGVAIEPLLGIPLSSIRGPLTDAGVLHVLCEGCAQLDELTNGRDPRSGRYIHPFLAHVTPRSVLVHRSGEVSFADPEALRVPWRPVGWPARTIRHEQIDTAADSARASLRLLGSMLGTGPLFEPRVKELVERLSTLPSVSRLKGLLCDAEDLRRPQPTRERIEQWLRALPDAPTPANAGPLQDVWLALTGFEATPLPERYAEAPDIAADPTVVLTETPRRTARPPDSSESSRVEVAPHPTPIPRPAPRPIVPVVRVADVPHPSPSGPDSSGALETEPTVILGERERAVVRAPGPPAAGEPSAPAPLDAEMTVLVREPSRAPQPRAAAPPLIEAEPTVIAERSTIASEPVRRIGEWNCVTLLGRGASAEVWRCHHVARTAQWAAVKLLLHVDPLVDEAARRRFFREAETLFRLNHPAIVTYFGFGTEPGYHLAMELLEGEDLQRLIERGPIPLAEAVHICRAVTAAIGHAHANNVFHRDVKPTNIVIARSGVKLVDFGIAIEADRDRLTELGITLGTLEYAPLEQMLSQNIDFAAADVYALGLVVYATVTGGPPVPRRPGEASEAWEKRIVQSKRLPFELDAKFPEELRELVRRTTHPVPAERLTDLVEVDRLLIAAAGQAKGEVIVKRRPVDTVPAPNSTPPVGVGTRHHAEPQSDREPTEAAPERPGPGAASSPLQTGLLAIVAISLVAIVILLILLLFRGPTA